MGLFARELEQASDERLMELVRKGDEPAFAALYDRYQGRLMSYFHRMLWKDRERAQDFVQELFTKLAQRPESYDPSRPFSTWLFSVANNLCKNEYRREEVRKRAEPELRYNGQGVQEAKGGDGVDRAAFRERLDAELDRLEPDHKATFVMRYHEDMAIKEIAGALGCSEGTVKSRLFYTLKKLAERLKEFDPRLMHHGQGDLRS
ncbi:MAG: RNA polymerase sigma factor [Flavobacteriales bacterium]|nr:RNA polymerase sigma factor [Flavobacteriales bacterium]MCB0789821.1 RNA polymerase sigma factor [Flavobacteriales bacterium]MCB9181555.1 RNA polymerase sigma factor [Flavobacteriales bacterium]HOP43555.1 RNA polymerase sigma factor [Flavobacteriales bacterium]HPF68126.1 RNA polymerase sigma factor [Flavobacteriales bacterium]